MNKCHQLIIVSRVLKLLHVSFPTVPEVHNHLQNTHYLTGKTISDTSEQWNNLWEGFPIKTS
jgi:hypothetical protein